MNTCTNVQTSRETHTHSCNAYKLSACRLSRTCHKYSRNSLQTHTGMMCPPSHTLPTSDTHCHISKLTSSMSALVLLSSGSLKSVYRMRIEFMLELAYWYSLLLLVIMITAISTSHRMLSSYAFFRRPALRLLNVICDSPQIQIDECMQVLFALASPVCFFHLSVE